MSVHRFAAVVCVIAAVLAVAEILTGSWGALVSTMVIAVLAALLYDNTWPGDRGEP